MTDNSSQSNLGRLLAIALTEDQKPRAARNIPADARQRYGDIARNDKYQHFVRIAPRIVRCLDHFAIEFDRPLVHDRLLAYYLFIGVVDEALDFGNLNIGRRILEHFDSAGPRFAEPLELSTVELVTEVLKSYVRNENRPLIYSRLAELYRNVVGEQSAGSIDSYIEHRKMIGRLTAELSYILVQDLLRGNTDAVFSLMMQVGKVGCLIDSVIDLNVDRQLGLLRFSPSTRDRIKLIACALCEGGLTLFRYPSLATLFLEAIVDNIRDRFRTGGAASPFTQPKDEAAGGI